MCPLLKVLNKTNWIEMNGIEMVMGANNNNGEMYSINNPMFNHFAQYCLVLVQFITPFFINNQIIKKKTTTQIRPWTFEYADKLLNESMIYAVLTYCLVLVFFIHNFVHIQVKNKKLPMWVFIVTLLYGVYTSEWNAISPEPWCNT